MTGWLWSYTNFWLAISNSPTEVSVSVMSTLPGLTYVILTNDDLTTTNWGIWQILLASNSITIAPPLALNSNALFFEGALAFSTGTNGLPDYWCMEYFGTLNVNPYADADGDGLCNLAEYTFGTNPTNAHSLSSAHTDAEALYLAYTNDPACHYQLFITNADTNTDLLTMSNTVVGTNYQIYSQIVSTTNGPWIVETNFLGTDTATTVAINLNGRSLNFVGGSGEDADGDSLPDGFEVLSTLTDPTLPDTGLTGTSDGYKDPDGDGYNNLQEYYNGTDPHVFNTPAGVAGLVADFPSGSNSVTFSWQAASGNVTGYIIDVWSDLAENWVPIYTNTATELSYVLPNPINYSVNTGLEGSFGIQPIYADGSAPLNTGGIIPHPVFPQAITVHGPAGKTYLLASTLTTNVIGFLSTDSVYTSELYPLYCAYFQTQFNYPAYWEDDYQTNIYIPATQFTNGVAVLSDSQAPPYWSGDSFQLLSPEFPAGVSGNAVFTAPAFQFANVPFVDGTAQMKQNIRFLLRAAGSSAFSYTITLAGSEYSPAFFSYPTDYVYSGLYYTFAQGLDYPSEESLPDYFAPFEDNYFFGNFIFDSSLVDIHGNLETGFNAWNGEEYLQSTNIEFEFPTFNYVVHSNSASIAGVLSSSDTPWVGYFPGGLSSISQFGAYASGSSVAFSTASNIYGLPYDSLELTLTNGGLHFATLSAGNNVSGYTTGPAYLGTAEPELQTVSYYFGNLSTDLLPFYGDEYFSVTNTTPMILGSVGSPMVIAGYAKQQLLNGSSNVFAYLGQYFTNAFVMSNGVLTTNSAGILSEYGEFFPTVPGHVGLLTKPDPDQDNMQGTNEIDIIRLSLDVNHDGTMDETYTGPDNTSASVPFMFWANNNYDRYVEDEDDGVFYDDDVATNSPAAADPYTGKPKPDCEYRYASGSRVIPCARDLQDFARLWVSGVSNVLSRLPSGSEVTLSWAGNGNSPTIDLFQAADPDGGIGYLTNSTIASEQVDQFYSQYVGRIGPGSNLVLNSSQFSNNWAGDHYIWCGVLAGNDQLNLTITDGSGNVLAKSSQSIQIQDLKQMYERWTVGDAPAGAPMTNALPAADDFSPGYPTQAFQYTYDPDYDTNDNYILLVHGWNDAIWEKDRFAESAYKRLYWQGYQGRFGSFRWPTDYGFTGSYWQALTQPHNYDNSEFTAWRSGVGLLNKLTNLNAHYPNHVYVLAHSMGNIVTGEALLLAGTNQVVNTYVASQAAVPAHAYDGSVTNPYLLPFNYAYPSGFLSDLPTFNRGPFTPNIYANIMATNSAAAGRRASLYNANDFALAMPRWGFNQILKPDILPSGEYYYAGSTNDPAPWNNFEFLTFGENPPLALDIVNNLQDRFEVFAYGAQAYSTALGATPIDTFNASVDMTSPANHIWPSPDPLGNGYASHFWHSAQFRGDPAWQWGYWNALLYSENGFSLVQP
jgi:hypothetical protein